MKPKPFETEIYRPDPEKPGYLKLERMATFGELFTYCEKALSKAGILDQLDYFSLMRDQKASEELPKGLRWIVVFAVTGGSEGFYIHIETIYKPDSMSAAKRELVTLGKDLSNKMDVALSAVNVLAPLLS